MHLKTKKAAREAGYKTHREWIMSHRIPYRDAEPVLVKLEEFYSEDQTEPLHTKSSAKKIGLCVRQDAKPAYRFYATRIGHYYVYRESDCRPKRVCKPIPPKTIELLLAIWTVNRAAERYDEASEAQYNGLAWHSSDIMAQLCTLKDRGIYAAIQQGLLTCEGLRGGLACYVGGGYCFHSTILPDNCDSYPADDDVLEIEAKPRTAREPRLKDAKFTLESLPPVPDAVQRRFADRTKPVTRREGEMRSHDEGDECGDHRSGWGNNED